MTHFGDSYFSRKAIGTLLASASLVSLPVAAQTVTEEDNQAAQRPAQRQVEEIIVTAERRSQNLQDVPIAATVLTAEDLARKGVNGVNDLQQVAPSLAISSINRSTFINIRGVGTALSAPNNSSGIAFYVDGQFIPKDFAIGMSFFDVGSVEVLRGPQGTLTGQNSTGGAIYIRTPEPVIGEFSGYVEQTASEYNHFRTRLAANIPISNTLALRVSGWRESRDSFSEQLGPSPSTPGNVDLYAFRANLLFEPSSSFGVNIRYTNFNDSNDNQAVHNRTLVPTLGPYKITEDAISYQHKSGNWISGEARWDVAPTVRWRTHLSYAKTKLIDQSDADRTATAVPPVGRIALVSIFDDVFIAETNLLSTGSSPFQWVVGAFYLDQEVPLNQKRDQTNTLTYRASTVESQLNTYNKSKAVFAQVNYKPIPEIELILGGRYSNDRQRVTTNTGIDDSFSFNKFTGRAAINYFATDGLMLYGSLTRGYKAGGGNFQPNVAPFAPEENTVYELGFKSTVLDRQLRINGAIYQSDYKGIQFNSLFNGLPILQNAASARSRGAEIEITGQFGDLSFNGGAAYNDGIFGRDVCLNNGDKPAGDPIRCAASVAAGRADDFVAKGNVLPFAPKWTLNAGIQYDIRLGGDATLTPRIQFSYIGDQITTPFPGINTIVPSYEVVGARIMFVPSERYKFEVFADNLLDKTYIVTQSVTSSTQMGGIIYGAPRQFGVRATIKLGAL